MEGINIKRKCYFINCGTTFDKDDKEKLFDCWNCNGNCCKSDLCNGLWCEDYGIFFNKRVAEDYIREYVKNGVPTTYGYLKEIDVDLSKDTWENIEQYLIDNYGYDNLDEVHNSGFISFDFAEIIDEFSSYWEQPDISYFKKDNEILKNVLIVKKQEELNSEIMDWINKELYNEKSDENILKH